MSIEFSDAAWSLCLGLWLIASCVVVGVVVHRFRRLLRGVDARAVARLDAARQELRSLEGLRDSLEMRNARLTQRAFRLERAVRGARAAAFCVEIETGMVLWHDGWDHLITDLDRPAAFGHMSDLLQPEAWDSLAEALKSAAVGEMVHRGVSCVDAHVRYGVRLTLTPDPRVLGQPATASGMFGFVPCEGEGGGG